MEKLFHIMNPVWEILFRVHDILSDILIRFGREIKWILLIIAHASLIVGVFHPELRRNFGEMAGTLLIMLLFLSPLSKIFRMKLFLLLMGFRREVGILMGYFACIHGISYMLRGYDIQNILSFTRWDFVTFAPLFGFVATYSLRMEFPHGSLEYGGSASIFSCTRRFFWSYCIDCLLLLVNRTIPCCSGG